MLVNKFYSISALFSVLLVTGCTTPIVNYQAPTKNISEPELNSVNQKQIGDDLLKQGKYSEQDAIRVTRTFPVEVLIDGGRSKSTPYTIQSGYFYKIGEDKEANYYRIGGGGEDFGFVERGTFSDPAESLMIKKTGNVVCILTTFSYSVCAATEATGIEKVKKNTISPDATLQTLVYNGKIGNRVNIGYREFSGNTARPVISNNVEYDLTESSKITYKGATIEVVEATGQLIKYKVISNFTRIEK